MVFVVVWCRDNVTCHQEPKSRLITKAKTEKFKNDFVYRVSNILDYIVLLTIITFTLIPVEPNDLDFQYQTA